jgi:hypothetical protein
VQFTPSSHPQGVLSSDSNVEWICIVAGALAMVASAAPAHAAGISDCPAPPGAVKVDLPSGLPPALRDAMGNIALPGDPFDSSDVYVKGHKYRRYRYRCEKVDQDLIG